MKFLLNFCYAYVKIMNSPSFNFIIFSLIFLDEFITILHYFHDFFFL